MFFSDKHLDHCSGQTQRVRYATFIAGCSQHGGCLASKLGEVFSVIFSEIQKYIKDRETLHRCCCTSWPPGQLWGVCSASVLAACLPSLLSLDLFSSFSLKGCYQMNELMQMYIPHHFHLYLSEFAGSRRKESNLSARLTFIIHRILQEDRTAFNCARFIEIRLVIYESLKVVFICGFFDGAFESHYRIILTVIYESLRLYLLLFNGIFP